MEYAQIVFYQLVIFVIYGAIGVAAVKGGVLDEAGLQAVSRVVIKVTLPVMLFTNVGFIGIPIIAMLFRERGMLYIAAFTIVDQPE